MKKILSFLAMILVVNWVMAQNDAIVTQTGDLNTAPVVQSGDLNFATVDQIGDNNNSSVVMKGLENDATVAQDGDDNDAILNMGNLVDKTSESSYGTIDQSGNGNSAELNISGEYHNYPGWGIFQIQVNADGLAGNRAVVNQTGFGNDMFVYQEGSGNVTNGNQNGGTYNQFYVNQLGTSNSAIIEQNGDYNYGDDHYVGGTNWDIPYWNFLYQEGLHNVGHVIQGSSNYLTMAQFGERNVAKAEQGFGTILETRQDGNDNIIGGLENCIPTDWLILDNFATLDAQQLGDNNKLYVNTAGDLVTVQDNTGTAGVGNTIKYSQNTQTLTGIVELTQIGDENLLWLKNTSAGTGSPLTMDVDVDQIGDRNTVASFENGVVTDCAKFAGSHLDIDQLGSDNSLHLNSTGAFNVVDVMQNGSNNWASVVQN